MIRTLALATGLALAACSTPLPPEERAQIERAALFEGDPRKGEEVNRICFAARIDGFRQSTERAVVVEEGTRDYLVTTRNRCTDLKRANSLAVNAFSGCLTRGDRLIGLDSAFGYSTTGMAPVPCFVDRMFKWDEDADDTEPSED